MFLNSKWASGFKSSLRSGLHIDTRKLGGDFLWNSDPLIGLKYGMHLRVDELRSYRLPKFPFTYIVTLRGIYKF